MKIAYGKILVPLVVLISGLFTVQADALGGPRYCDEQGWGGESGAGRHRILQRINMVAGAYGLRLISQWTLRLSTRHVREWLVGYRTQLKGGVVVDASYIDREYRDRPAQIDTMAANGTVWSGVVNPTLSNTYFITNNKWNWFVYQGYEIT
jgi:hypothetical protein